MHGKREDRVVTVELWRQRGLGALKVGTLRLADDGTVHFSGVTSADEEFLRGLCVA